ncbi:MAG: prepilin-type N-terminal cleavage/methylation domain-containing protein [Patescibacteria group bacterium]
MSKHTTQPQGFTIVETLVAITILLIAIAAPITIVVRTAQSSAFAGEQVVATFLAQEGLELAQKERDDHYLDYFEELLVSPPADDEPWAWFIDFGGNFGTTCRVNNSGERGCGMYPENVGTDGEATSVATKCTDRGCPIYFDDSAGVRARYTHVATGNTLTPYTREVKVIGSSDPTNPEMRVQSIVRWRTGTLGATQEVIAESSLFNIYDTP